MNCSHQPAGQAGGRGGGAPRFGALPTEVAPAAFCFWFCLFRVRLVRGSLCDIDSISGLGYGVGLVWVLHGEDLLAGQIESQAVLPHTFATHAPEAGLQR